MHPCRSNITITKWGLLRNVLNLLTFYPIIKPYGLLKINIFIGILYY